jgi:hypothetical protein
MWSEPNHGYGCNCSECHTSYYRPSCNGGDDIYKKEIEYLKSIIAKQADMIYNLTQIVDAKVKGTEQYVPDNNDKGVIS